MLANHEPDEDRIFWDATLARHAWAVRGHHLPAGQAMPSLGALIKELNTACWADDARAVLSDNLGKSKVTVDEAVRLFEATFGESIDLDAVRQGVPFALRVIAGAGETRWRRNYARLRTLIANLGEIEYRAAAAEAERLCAGAPSELVAVFCFLFPTEPTALRWVAANPCVSTGNWPNLPSPPQPGSIPNWWTFDNNGVFNTRAGMGTLAASLVHSFGFEALPALLAVDCPTASERRGRAVLFARIGADEAFATLLEDLDDRSVAGALADACTLQPARALRMLPAVTGPNADLARRRLAVVADRHPELVPVVAEQLLALHRRVLLDAAPAQVVVAPMEALPEVLSRPPWERSGAAVKRPTLDIAPIPLAPVLRWEPSERKRALDAGMFDEFYRFEALPRQIAEMEQRIAAVERDQQAGVEPDRSAHLAWLAEHLSELRREFERLSQPLERQAAQWIADGQVTPSRMMLMPAEYLAEAVRTAPAPAPALYVDPALGWRRVLAIHGEVTAEWVAAAVLQAPPQSVGEVLMLGSTQLALHAAKALVSKDRAKSGRRWLLAQPDHAAAGLIPAALATPSKDSEAAERAMRLLADTGHGELIRRHAASAGGEVAAAIDAILALDPLSRFPRSRRKLPDWVAPAALPPVETSNGAGVLPKPAVDALLTMLAFTRADDPYVGISHVKDACTPDSLGRFAWRLLQHWLGGGAPAAHDWAFQAMGLIGDDECARRLPPLLRAWKREGAGARAASGLDVLVNIGSDVSLMQLSKLAQSTPKNSLTSRAQERIADLAEARGLTMEELADLLVPDLGLDEDGTMWFDFGPRRFQVGFDELLAPFVKDESGAQLRALPKPNSKDDPELATGAADRWKALKKDASDAAKIQIRRIELAMGTKRRWDVATFRSCFVDHPLMGHVARRLVWATYDESGAVTGTFRVAEDRSFADVNDDLWELPGSSVTVGIPHVLELDAQVAGGWGDVIANYELFQPFDQLGRDTYTLSDAERDAVELATVEGVVCHFGKIVSLEGRGWHKGEMGDGGAVLEMVKPLSGGLFAVLNLTEGLWVRMLNETPDQPLGTVVISTSSNSWDSESGQPLKVIDPVELSELIRDLESLRS